MPLLKKNNLSMGNIWNELQVRFSDLAPTDRWDVEVCLLNKKTKLPIIGNNLKIKFFDKDPKENDFLGEGPVNEKGIADIRFITDLMRTGSEEKGDEKETLPDLFFQIWDGDALLFTSSVLNDVDFERNASFDMKDGKEFNFGTFLIDISS